MTESALSGCTEKAEVSHVVMVSGAVCLTTSTPSGLHKVKVKVTLYKQVKVKVTLYKKVKVKTKT